MSKSNLQGFNYDKDKVIDIYREVEKNGDLINNIVDGILKKYCEELDNYVKFINSVLEDTDNPPSSEELDDFVMQLPTYMYFAGQGQEALGIRDDISQAYKKEVYSNAYNVAEGTVGEKNAIASLESQQEEIVSIAYQRAYKKMKHRMDMAQEILQSIKKVMSRRMAEQHTTNTTSGGTR